MCVSKETIQWISVTYDIICVVYKITWFYYMESNKFWKQDMFKKEHIFIIISGDDDDDDAGDDDNEGWSSGIKEACHVV